MQISFENKIILVTGASRGIGRAAAIQFAASGATVVVHYHRDKSAADEVHAGLPGSGHRTVRADMGDVAEVLAMAEQVIAWYGRIDILVNNAGIFSEHDMTGMPVEEFLEYWDRTIRVNLTGPAVLSNLVAREMIRAGGGRIVNITSRGAFRGEPEAWAYGASKAGLNSTGQSMARALAPHRVYVFTLAPGYVDTDMASPYLAGDRRSAIESQSPMQRVAQPDEIAHAVIMLASDGMEYMTGCILDMNGASYLRM
jgi:NAD(P)-dependent dehydrogenase (short-subunit alcohol dehydrogenase family)